MTTMFSIPFRRSPPPLSRLLGIQKNVCRRIATLPSNPHIVSHSCALPKHPLMRSNQDKSLTKLDAIVRFPPRAKAHPDPPAHQPSHALAGRLHHHQPAADANVLHGKPALQPDPRLRAVHIRGGGPVDQGRGRGVCEQRWRQGRVDPCERPEGAAGLRADRVAGGYFWQLGG